MRRWWPAFAVAALALWIVVSLSAAIAAVDNEYLVRPREFDSLTERATCYSPDRAKYEACVRSRFNGRNAGIEPLKPPMLTPFRVSLCATLQYRFSWDEFWECAKALGDPRR